MPPCRSPGTGVDHRQGIARLAHAAGAGGVKGAFAMLGDEGVDRLVGGDVGAGLDLGSDIARQGGLPKISRVRWTQVRKSAQSSGCDM
jgi:hypothetical protein